MLLLVLSAAFSGSETAFFSLGPVDRARLEKEGGKASRRVLDLLHRSRELLSALLVGNLLVNIAASIVATNLCLNRLRDRRGAPEPTEDDTLARLARLEDPGPAAEARFTLGRLFARHKDSTRTIATLHFVDGLTLEQTAREVGMSVSGVRKRLRGLRESLLQMEAS